MLARLAARLALLACCLTAPALARPEPETSSATGPQRLLVVAPRQLRPHTDYHVLVSLSNSSAPASVELQLTGGRDSDRELADAQSLLIESGETQTLSFKLTDWPPAEYVLSVSATAVDRSWSFAQEATVAYVSKAHSALLQTDRRLYKPGQLLHIRALLVSPELEPVKVADKSINVSLADPGGNLIKQWLGLSAERGLLTLDTRLAAEARAGNYALELQRGLHTRARRLFAVANYELPPFEVELELQPGYVTYNDSRCLVRVRARYTYGKPVRGHVSLSVAPLVRFNALDTRPLQQVQRTGPLSASDGTASFDLDLTRDLGLQRDLFERKVEFFALVEEELSGQKHNATALLGVHDKPLRVLRTSADTFKPGLNYTLQLRLERHDGSPLDDGSQLELRWTLLGSPGSPAEASQSARLRVRSGSASHLIPVPSMLQGSRSAPRLMHLQATVLPGAGSAPGNSHTHQLDSLVAFSAPAGPEGASYAQLELLGPGGSRDAASIGDQLTMRVRATRNMQQVLCQGVARGDIVWAVSKWPPGGAGSANQLEFAIKVSAKMAPETQVLCLVTVAANSTHSRLLAAGGRARVSGLTGRNPVRLSSSRDQVAPGERLELAVATSPHSQVGVLAVDEAALLLRADGSWTLDEPQIDDELRSYGAPGSGSPEAASTALNARNAMEVVQAAQVHVMSNLPGLAPASSTGRGRGGSADKSIALDGLALGSGELVAPSAEIAAQSANLKSRKPQASDRLVSAELIRNQFPETWLWLNTTSGPDGVARIHAKAPHSITTYRLSAFSLSEYHGLGVSDGRTRIRVWRPFFVRLNLPHSVVRGETLWLQAMVFNYGKRPTSARVTVELQGQDFELLEPPGSNEVSNTSGEPNANITASRQVRVAPDSPAPVGFLVRAKRSGALPVRLVARSELAADALEQHLLVEPDGEPQHINNGLLVYLDPDDEQPFARNLSIHVPGNAVPGSQRVRALVYGDLMGPVLAQQLQSSGDKPLLRLPTGSGEANLIHVAPAITLLKYLRAAGKLRDSDRAKLVGKLETGYAQQLNFKRSDGSFSAFGESDPTGSVWLTAYVLKTLGQARQASAPLVVDGRVVREATAFVARHAQADGSLREPTAPVDTSGFPAGPQAVGLGRGRSAPESPLYLSAYVAVAMMQQPQSGEPGQSQLAQKLASGALDYVQAQLEGSPALATELELAMAAYALQLGSRRRPADAAYEQLWARARHSSELTWWQPSSSPAATSGTLDQTNPGDISATSGGEHEHEQGTESVSAAKLQQPPPLKQQAPLGAQSAHLLVPEAEAVEASAYALLATVQRADLARALPVARWLASHQSELGGFASTQDTVVAIEALAEFAAAARNAWGPRGAHELELELAHESAQPKLRSPIRPKANQISEQQFHIGPHNELAGQALELANNASWLQVSARGRGLVLVQLANQYNLLVSAEKPAFYLNPIIDKTSNRDYLQLSVCTYFKGLAGDQSLGEPAKVSNLALLEVHLPSGYQADSAALDGLRRAEHVRRVESLDGNTRVLVYLDQLGPQEVCLTLAAHRTSRVARVRPVPVSIYDYYERRHAARIFYEPPAASDCDLCESEPCKRACSGPTDSLGAPFQTPLHEQRGLRLLTADTHGQLRQAPQDQQAWPPQLNGTAPGQLALNATALLPLSPLLDGLISVATRLYQHQEPAWTTARQ